MEPPFEKLDGVVSVVSGYSGGTEVNPTYEQVCTDKTGHAEAVQLKYDPEKASYDELLNVFWSLHDPTQLDRQGDGVGKQYRSAVFYHTDEQKKLAEKSKEALEKIGRHDKPIVTEIMPASDFWKAEEHHQKYLAKRGEGICHT